MPKTRRSDSASAEAAGAQGLQRLSAQPNAPGARELSPARKRFDRLLRDLQQHRAQLHAWREEVERWRSRYHAEVMPLFAQRRALEIEQIHVLDKLHATVKLGKADRAFLSDEICNLVGPLIEEGQVDLKPIYERHSDIGYDDEIAQSDEMMKHVIGQLYGLDPDEVDAVDTPEQLYERVSARLDAAQAQEDDDARAQAGRGGTGRGRRRSAKSADQAEPPALRELYRKLASNLHPDRASGADDHLARTALMQRLNAAYKANDLLGLLELQAEIGLLDASGVDALAPARLQEYNRELDRQCKELKHQLTQHAMDFCFEYDLDLPTQPKPERLDRLLTQYKREVVEEVDGLRQMVRELGALSDVRVIKRWLKFQRSIAFH